MRANEDDDDDDESDKAEIRRKLERLTNACRSNLGPFGGGGGGGYSRYELRRIWPYKESEISFEKTTSLFAESAMMREKKPHAGRKVDVEKLMENVFLLPNKSSFDQFSVFQPSDSSQRL